MGVGSEQTPRMQIVTATNWTQKCALAEHLATLHHVVSQVRLVAKNTCTSLWFIRLLKIVNCDRQPGKIPNGFPE